MSSIEYSEVYGILLMLGNSYIEKIPDTIMDIIMSRLDKDNIPTYSFNDFSDISGISDNARKMIELISLKYWKN